MGPQDSIKQKFHTDFIRQINKLNIREKHVKALLYTEFLNGHHLLAIHGLKK